MLLVSTCTLHRFQAAVNLATFDLSASLIGNTFTLASDANISTDENFRPDYRIGLLALLSRFSSSFLKSSWHTIFFSSPGDVNITGNSLEVLVRGRHGHHGFVAAEEQLGREELSEFILIEPSDADALVDGNTFVLRYTDWTVIDQRYFWYFIFLRCPAPSS